MPGGAWVIICELVLMAVRGVRGALRRYLRERVRVCERCEHTQFELRRAVPEWRAIERVHVHRKRDTDLKV